MSAFEPISSDRPGRFCNGRCAAQRTITDILVSAQVVRIATACFEGSGFQTLQDVLQGCDARLLVWRRVGGEDALRLVLDEFVHEPALCLMEQRTRAMWRMLKALEQGRMTAAVGREVEGDLPELDARYLHHHAKLYLAD